VTLKDTTPRNSERVPDAPSFEKGSVTEEIWPVPTVKLVADPMAAPLALTKEMLPVQEAAVPLEEAAAVFTTLIWAVSVLARPIGPKPN